MSKRMEWFVLHTLTGQEQKVQRYMLAQARIQELGDYVGDVVIPMEKVSETKDGKKRTINRKFFPGYVLINVALYDYDDDDGKRKDVVERTWSFIRSTPGIIGFIGGEKPAPLPEEEVSEILNQVADRKDKVRPKITFEPGETVRITDGPFMNFSGSVEEVDPDKGMLKVSVEVFSRNTLVELEYSQVERQEQQPPAPPQM